MPTIQAVIRHKMGSFRMGRQETRAEADAAEMESAAAERVIKRLRDLESCPTDVFIQNLKAYTASAARSAFGGLLRKSAPGRYRLAGKLKAALDRANGLAIWEKDCREIVGYAVWEGKATASPGRLQELLARPAEAVEAACQPASAKDLATADLICKVLDWLGGPVEFDRLLSALYIALPSQDLVRDQGAEDERPEPAAAGASAEHVLSERSKLEWAWPQILELSLNQRRALLLNAQDSKGDSALLLIAVTLRLSPEELAEALELSVEELCQLACRLPLEDKEIAVLLGVRVDQVIGLRKAAREKLERRKSKIDEM